MTRFRVRLSDFSIDYMLHCSIRPIDSLPIAQESLLNVPLKTTAKTDEINRVISTNTGNEWGDIGPSYLFGDLSFVCQFSKQRLVMNTEGKLGIT